MPTRKKLLKGVVDKLVAEGGTDALIWDSEIRGFGVRAKPSGAKSWILQYRNEHGRSKRLTLGSVTDLTPSQAREMAEIHRGDIRRGKDPVEARKGARNAVTVALLCDDYLETAKIRLKPVTLAADRGRIECHIKPLLGSKVVKDLKASDVERFIAAVIAGKTAKQRPKRRKRGSVAAGGAGAATRAASLLGTILERAVKDEIVPRNVAHGVPLPKDTPREQPFSFARVSAVGRAMRETEAHEIGEWGAVREFTPTLFRIARHLMLSGCRKSEALTLQWGDIDFAAGCLRLRDTKTGKQVRPVGRAALDHLASFKPRNAATADYVFPGKLKGAHFVGFTWGWDRVAKAAKVDEISAHGLRHWFASAAAEMNYSDFIIGGLLGHSKRGVTGRYANAPDTALIQAADRVSQRLVDALDGKAPGKVVQIGRA